MAAAESTGRTAALVPAAGRGERLGPGAPKALRPLGGVPMLVHAVRALAASRTVDLVVVAAQVADYRDADGDGDKRPQDQQSLAP